MEVVGLDQPAEARRARDVRPLADHDERGVLGEGERLEPAEARDRTVLGNPARRDAADRRGNRACVVGRRPATAADDVDEPALGELSKEGAGRVRPFVVAAESIGQARIRVGARVAVGEAGELLHVVAHLTRAQRAVDPDDQGSGVLDRSPEGLQGLAGERPAREVDDRHRDPERDLDVELVEHVARGHDGRFGVERVEDRLDQEQVDAAVDEASHLLRVALAHVVESDRPVRRVVHLGRKRERLVERAERAGDEPRPVFALVAGLPGEPGTLEVQLVDDVLEAVVRLPDARSGEGVRRRQVGAGLQVGPVDVEDDVGPRQVEQVGIAGDLVRVVTEALAAVVRVREPARLQHRPPGPVEHQDPLRKKLAQELCPGGRRRRHGDCALQGADRVLPEDCVQSRP